jgi:putative hydrolase of the HAD superfamily
MHAKPEPNRKVETRPNPPATDVRSLQAIITDVDGTLYDARAVRRQIAQRLLQANFTQPVLAWKTIRCLRAFRRAQEDIRKSTRRDLSAAEAQYSRTCEVTGYPQEFVRQTVACWMEQEPLSYIALVAYADARPFFEWAVGRGIQLAAVSDYPLERKLQALRLADLFPVAISPGIAPDLRFKPHPAMLVRAVEQLGTEPARSLYIGDRPEVDGAAAKAAGMMGAILSWGHNPGWKNGLWYANSFTELRQLLGLQTVS